MKLFRWNDDKNLKLKIERGVSFEIAVRHIQNGEILDVLTHPNPKKYPNQKIYVIQMNNYVYYIPFVENEDEIFLKNIIPSRKYKNLYNKEANHEEN
jgi:hypothetical protein